MGWLPDWLTGQAKRDAEATEAAARVKLERQAMIDAELDKRVEAERQAAPVARVENQLRPSERLFPDQINRLRDLHDNPRQPEEIEATRLELTRTPQPPPTIAGPGMTFGNSRAKPPPRSIADEILAAADKKISEIDKGPGLEIDTSPSIFPDHSKGLELNDDKKGKGASDQQS